MSLDYLVIGNVTKDLFPHGGFTIGGTATYAARTVHALGWRVAVVTSAESDLDLDVVLPGIQVALQPSQHTLTFENVYTPAGRVQFVHALAALLDLDSVPLSWCQPKVVHLAPLAGECDPALVDAFPGALVGVTPQGWMRTWDRAGRVRATEWHNAEDYLPRVRAVIVSVKDVGGDETTIARLAELAPILVVTLGAHGCRVYAGGAVHHVVGTPVPEVDPTGAGDIFAAAFLVCLYQHGDPLSAARFANRVAALSVKREGWAATPTAEEVAGIECEE